MNCNSFLTIGSVNSNCYEKSHRKLQDPGGSAPLEEWSCSWCLHHTPRQVGGAGLRAARGSEERPAQPKLCWQCPAETTAQRRNGLQQPPLPPTYPLPKLRREQPCYGLRLKKILFCQLTWNTPTFTLLVMMKQ